MHKERMELLESFTEEELGIMYQRKLESRYEREDIKEEIVSNSAALKEEFDKDLQKRLDLAKLENRPANIKSTPHCSSNKKFAEIPTELMPMVESETVGGFWLKKLTYTKGQYKAGHHHNFDHIHLVGKGAVEMFEVRDDGDFSLGKFVEGETILVKKFIAHRVVALADDTMSYCIQVAPKDGETL